MVFLFDAFIATVLVRVAVHTRAVQKQSTVVRLETGVVVVVVVITVLLGVTIKRKKSLYTNLPGTIFFPGERAIEVHLPSKF
jgi:hypothetical protein